MTTDTRSADAQSTEARPVDARPIDTGHQLPGADIDPTKLPGHWTLAKMGKRVLRPGGLELTGAILSQLRIGTNDDVVEFAPGLGATAALILARSPATYTGVESEPAAAATVRTLLRGERDRCIEATAQKSGIDDASADVVTGEAFLTMQSNDNKRHIVEEAFRLLRPGGRYGLHEMCLRPDSLGSEVQDRIRDELTRSIRVGARPLTVAEWRALLEDAGFIVEYEKIVDMALLRPKRLVADEGFVRAIKIVFNIVRHPAARQRVKAMRAVFNAHREQLGAVALVATKPATA